MKKKILSLALAVIMAFGLAAPAVAAGQTFSDVPENHWAYADVEAAAAAGLMNGTGNGKFSPNLKVTVAQFLTLLGRLVFPDTKVTEGASWYGPYVTKAQEGRLLAGTQVDTGNVEAEISRYDMAVILRAAAKKLGVTEKSAQSSEVTDFGMVPNMYTDAVLAVYGMGLIKGDQAGNFNGSNTMIRAEVATVIMRLAKAKPSGTTGPGTTTDPEKPEETEKPTEPEEPTKPDDKGQTTEEYLADNQEEFVTYTVGGYFQKTDHDIGRPAYDKHYYNFPDMPYKVYYTNDGGKTSVLVGEGITGNDSGNVRGKRTGEFSIEVKLPKDAFSPPNKDQKGIYISAETELDGQKLVTSDLRTDGRAYVMVQDPKIRLAVELTPPTGEKAKFTFSGNVVYGPGGRTVVGSGFTVQLYLKDGRLVAEDVTNANGAFSMYCEVDAIDAGFDPNEEQYYVTAIGVENGVQMEREAWSPTCAWRLWSMDFMGANPHNPSGMPVTVY